LVAQLLWGVVLFHVVGSAFAHGGADLAIDAADEEDEGEGFPMDGGEHPRCPQVPVSTNAERLVDGAAETAEGEVGAKFVGFGGSQVVPVGDDMGCFLNHGGRGGRLTHADVKVGRVDKLSPSREALFPRALRVFAANP
jgi:hypothetical protein